MTEKHLRIPLEEKVNYLASGEGSVFILEVLGKQAKREGWSNDKLAEKILAVRDTVVRLREGTEGASPNQPQ